MCRWVVPSERSAKSNRVTRRLAMFRTEGQGCRQDPSAHAHILIQIPLTPLVPNRIPCHEPPQLRVVVPIAVIEEPGFVIEPTSGERYGIGDYRVPNAAAAKTSLFPKASFGLRGEMPGATGQIANRWPSATCRPPAPAREPPQSAVLLFSKISPYCTRSSARCEPNC